MDSIKVVEKCLSEAVLFVMKDMDQSELALHLQEVKVEFKNEIQIIANELQAGKCKEMDIKLMFTGMLYTELINYGK